MPPALQHSEQPAERCREVGRFQLIEWYEDMRVELYNLKDDLGEHYNLAPKIPKKVDELWKLLRNWRTEVKAQMPTLNPDYNPAGFKPDKKKKRKAGKKSAGLSKTSNTSHLLAADAGD